MTQAVSKVSPNAKKRQRKNASPLESEKALRADVVDGVVLFTFESVLAEFGDPGLTPVPAEEVEPWGLKDKHLPETVKENMYGESVTGYLFDRKALEEYESMMIQAKTAETSVGGAGSESDNPGTAQSDESELGGEAGGSGGDFPGGSQDGGEVGAGGQDPVLLDSGPASQIPG